MKQKKNIYNKLLNLKLKFLNKKKIKKMYH